MTISIPVWLLWTIDIICGSIVLMIIGAVIMYFMFGYFIKRSIARGLNL